jgi:nitroreductase
MPVENCPPIQEELRLSLAQCRQHLSGRRSIRAYKEKPVPQNELLQLIDIARYAPTGHNSQSVQWLVLGNKDKLKQFAGITGDWMRWMLENNREIALALDMEPLIRRWEEGKDIILRNAPVVLVTHAPKGDLMAPTSSIIALAYLELAATGMGLGTCWAGLFNAAATTFPPMMAALPLPEGHHCTGAMMVGYPRFAYRRLPLRKSPAITWRLA